MNSSEPLRTDSMSPTEWFTDPNCEMIHTPESSICFWKTRSPAARWRHQPKLLVPTDPRPDCQNSHSYSRTMSVSGLQHSDKQKLWAVLVTLTDVSGVLLNGVVVTNHQPTQCRQQGGASCGAADSRADECDTFIRQAIIPGTHAEV